MNPEYREYMNSPAWRKLRKRVLVRDRYQCQTCGHISPHNDVHHKTYIRFKAELMRDLVTMCRYCHERLHERLEREGKKIGKTETGVGVPSTVALRRSEKAKKAVDEALAKIRQYKKYINGRLKEQKRKKPFDFAPESLLHINPKKKKRA
jgi:5-methylcytosine-specific restriction protein A